MPVGKRLAFAVVASILGLAVLAAAFEAASGLYGLYDDWRRAFPKARPEARNIILCAGDSHTQGVGAPRGRGYPEQLQELLDERRPGFYAVLNIGDSGTNTTQAVRGARRWLDKYAVSGGVSAYCPVCN
ncbi:MAG: hypothetical protein M5R36_23805 [Deltaproteobacteria bacterium]|nr:hypothetical protein [Deltaproteobacteria bacterium]